MARVGGGIVRVIARSLAGGCMVKMLPWWRKRRAVSLCTGTGMRIGRREGAREREREREMHGEKEREKEREGSGMCCFGVRENASEMMVVEEEVMQTELAREVMQGT
jgi:hypothetical protein